MFRNGLFTEFPAWFFRVPIGDVPLHVLNAQHGGVCYLSEVMAVHRVHSGGIWSSRDSISAQVANIELYHIFGNVLPAEYQPVIYRRSLGFLQLVGNAFAEQLGSEPIAMIGIHAAEQEIGQIATEYRLGNEAQAVALKAFFAHLLFNRKANIDGRALRHILVRTVKSDFGLLRNRSFWYFAIEAYAGRSVAELLRHGFRRGLSVFAQRGR